MSESTLPAALGRFTRVGLAVVSIFDTSVHAVYGRMEVAMS
jgi:hypothetical protein